MKAQPTAQGTPITTGAPASAAGARDRRLRLAHVLIVVVTVLALALAIVSIPLRFASLSTPCAVDPCATGAFVGQKGRLGPEGVRRLLQMGVSLEIYAAYLTMLDAIRIAVGFVPALMLVWRQPVRRMTLVNAVFFVAFGVSVALDTLAARWPVWEAPAAVQHALGGTTLVAVYFYLFPDGRFVPRWTRWAAGVLVPWQALSLIFPGSPLDASTWSFAAPLVVQLVWWFTAVAAQVYRYRYASNAVQRQQTKWVVLGFVGMMVTLTAMGTLVAVVPAARQPGSLLELAVQTVANVALLLLPVCVWLAIVRYRLWDIDILISRTLVYGALTACVVGLYVLLVSGLGTLWRHAQTGPDNPLLALVATGLVAVMFQPLREHLQRAVNRLLWGDRDDPYAVLSRLGRRLEATLAPDAVLPTVVTTVKEALKLPYAAITLPGDDTPIVAAGQPVGELLRVQLSHAGVAVGQLLLSPRAAGEEWTRGERRLLEDLAHQAGATVHGVRLTMDLQRARERLVLAREEERRRLRRDLHDDLAPTLAAMALTAATAGDLMDTDPGVSKGLLSELHGNIRATVGDIRRLVYDLRPPTLDELGLAAAVRERATQIEGAARAGEGSGAQGGAPGLRVMVEAPDRLPPLPAAVEVAAYRIVQEALNNVLKHAKARTCVIRLDIEADALAVEVRDDGLGLRAAGAPERRIGVGLHAMRERATELGGSCAIEPIDEGGTCVRARLPLPRQAGMASLGGPGGADGSAGGEGDDAHAGA